ncbi:noggin-3-like [Amphiura filiformis]|uniref:noggin-3-like n=1 Tax=Amphiura filiformis TaxID=82378 RepID=UPI003B213504
MEWQKYIVDPICLLITAFVFLSQASKDTSRPALKVSDKTQPLPLVEVVPDSMSLPTGRDMNPKRLRRKLGDHFDKEWMSVEEPSNKNLGSEVIRVGNYSWLLEELNSLHISSLPSSVTDQLQAWLLAKAFCPVSYQWTNIGPLFWPPWVKRGSCVEKSCSWPSGMMCVPGQTTIIRLMRWHCRPSSSSRASGGREAKCKWLQVPYPVTSECTCSCA